MAIFPGAVATDVHLYLVSNNLATALTAGIDAVVATIPVVSTTGFPTTGWITIDQEAIQYTGITGTSFTGCTRGAGGTVAASHLIGAGVKQTVVAAHHNSLKDEIKAIEQYLSDHLGLATVVTAAEFERLVGVTSPIQTQLNGKEPTITVLPISKGGTNSGSALNNQRIIKSESGAIVEAPAIIANRALASDSNGIPVHTAVTDTELGRVSGVTSPIQTQLDGKVNDTGDSMTGALAMGSNKITGLAAATTNGDAVRYEQLPGPAGTITGWASYTPTIGGASGTTTMSMWWRRVGDTLIVQGWVHSTTWSAVNLSCTLPNSVTIDTAKIGNTRRAVVSAVQAHGTGSSPNFDTITFFDGSDTANVYFGNGMTSEVPDKRTGSSFFGASNPTVMFIAFQVPISGWSI